MLARVHIAFAPPLLLLFLLLTLLYLFREQAFLHDVLRPANANMWFGRIGMVRLRSVFVVAPAAAASFLLSSTSSGVRIGFALADMEFDRDGYAYPPSTLGPSFEHPYSYLSPSETAASPDVRVSETLLKGTNSRTEDALASTAAGSPTNGTTGTDTEEAVIITAVPTTTATTASSPSNTQPCNLHLEFCTRSYGEITYVGAHNSPFVRQNNAASNQRLDVVTQLDDGIRMRMRPLPSPRQQQQYK